MSASRISGSCCQRASIARASPDGGTKEKTRFATRPVNPAGGP
ncbi:hypothetical protein [Bilophila wadsworthia]